MRHAHASCPPPVRPSRRATAPPRDPCKRAPDGPRSGPASRLGWVFALQVYALGIYLTLKHPNFHVASRSCPRAAHFMPCCMWGLMPCWGGLHRPEFVPPRATGLGSCSLWVVRLPPMASCRGVVRYHRMTPPIPPTRVHAPWRGGERRRRTEASGPGVPSS